MIKVYVKKTGNYPVSSPKIKGYLRKFLEEKGIVSDADVSVSIVSETRMKILSKQYLNEGNGVHNVLSFPFVGESDDFVEAPDNVIHLGEIVICYPKVVEEAKKESKLIDEKVRELVEHAALHLLGEHH